MDSGRATVRNMRSKCRCSCVLQFTFRHAVNCVLHRPPSQVIHCIVLYFSHFQTKICLRFQKRTTFIQYPHGEGHKRNPGKGEDSLDGFSNLLTATESPLENREPYPRPGPAGESVQALTALRRPPHGCGREQTCSGPEEK